MLKRVWEVSDSKEFRNVLIKYLGDYIFIIEPKGIDQDISVYTETGECDGVKYGVRILTDLGDIPEIKDKEYDIEASILGVKVQFDCDVIKFTGCITGMFSGFNAKALILRGLDTSLANNMDGMFAYVSSDIYGLEILDTRSVVSMNSMFEQCQSNILNVSSFDTSKVVSMKSMFKDCKTPEIKVMSWDVSRVIIMDNMFNGCRAKLLQLHNWNARSLISINCMFAGCNVIEPIDLRGIDVNLVRKKRSLFTGSKAQFVKIMT